MGSQMERKYQMLSCTKASLFQMGDEPDDSSHMFAFMLIDFNYKVFILTWVKVFGFGQLNSGTRLFLQLYDGLAALANYRAGCIAGDQHLQEVLTLLWGRDTQSGKGSHLVK